MPSAFRGDLTLCGTYLGFALDILGLLMICFHETNLSRIKEEHIGSYGKLVPPRDEVGRGAHDDLLGAAIDDVTRVGTAAVAVH